jgi:hypothetical protein
MLLPWREAALADPYTSTARRRFFQDRKFVSALYLESDQQASPADWQSFFKVTSTELAGRFLVFRSAQERSFSELLAADFDFWLYVVEPDERGGYRVLPIRNPARLVARYQFRGGVWRHFAEQT